MSGVPSSWWGAALALGLGGAGAAVLARAPVVAHAPSQLSAPPSISPSASRPEASAALPTAGETLSPSTTPPPLSKGATNPADALKGLREALRSGAYREATRVIDALPPGLGARPEVHLARAKAALALGQVEEARTSLSGIADPTLASERSEIEAQALGRRPPPRGPRERELVSREERVAQSRASGNQALLLQNLRWLAVQRPQSEAGVSAFRELNALGQTLTLAERDLRWVHLAEAGKLDQLEEELTGLGPANSKRSVAVSRARALALYRERRYGQAVEALDAVAAVDARNAREYRYYAAKALSRLDRDEEAKKRYSRLAKEQGPFADHAHYQLARLEWLTGQREKAFNGLESYLRRFRKSGKNSERAEYDLGVLSLSLGRAKPALRALQDLIRRKMEERERARLEELLGVAYLTAGQRDSAEQHFRRSIAADPLSLAANFARLRLADLGLSTPAMLAAPRAEAPQGIALALPSVVARLDEVGLDREAEQRLERELPRLPGVAKEALGPTGCELFGQLERAERQYRFAQHHAKASELRFAPEGPHRWHWRCLFPEPHRGIVHEAARESQVEPALVYAIMRQESAFRPEVSSSAGAIGLMQLIPPTAARAAQELELADALGRLSAPQINVRLGAHYLGHLLRLFEGSLLPSVAAYNAGPQAVSRWLERFGDLPLDVFTAAIPYEETRNYVYRVLGNLSRYQTLTTGRENLPLNSLTIPRPPTLGPDVY